MLTKVVKPLPIRDDWTPSYLRARGDANRDFAFWLIDEQGAPGPGGERYHGGVDWFAPGRTPVVAPFDGRIVRADRSTDVSGPVYGGVCGISRSDGVTFIFRHVNPTRNVGERVSAGDKIATVTDWQDGGDHAHMEIHQTSPGRYDMSDMFDPKDWTYVEFVPDQPIVEKVPPDGNTLRFVLHHKDEEKGDVYAGWGACEGVFRWLMKNNLDPNNLKRVFLAWRGESWTWTPELPVEKLREIESRCGTLIKRFVD